MQKIDNNQLRLTRKGIALVAAITADLLPQIEGGLDTTKFEKFWELYDEEVQIRYEIKRYEPVKRI